MKRKQNAGRQIRQAREAVNLSLDQVARPLGRSFVWLARIETGSLNASDGKVQLILDAIAKVKSRDTASIKPIPPRVRKGFLADALAEKT